MIYRYTCTNCGILVRVDHKATGREIAACLCDAEIVEEVEPE
jgi:predicted nucleic acid-binding Zn ribbon protein